MSKLLINEEPLQVLPSLAATIGLNEAIMLQQIHYWLRRSKHIHDGRPWIYNTYKDWKAQFPWWGERTIERIVASLRSLNLIETTKKYNQAKMDQTLWYTINYDVLNAIELKQVGATRDAAKLTDSVPGIPPDWRDGGAKLAGSPPPSDAAKMTRPIPREDQENTYRDSRSAVTQPALDIPIEGVEAITEPVVVVSAVEQFRALIVKMQRERNRTAVLMDVYKLCYGEADLPSYGRLGAVAQKVGGAGRLADLLWQHTSRPPTGNVLDYIEKAHHAKHRKPEAATKKQSAFASDFQGNEA